MPLGSRPCDQRARALLLALLCALSAQPVTRAAELKGTVLVRLPAERAVWAGQAFEFAVELGTPGQFVGAPRFDLPQIDGAILMQLDPRPLLGTREDDGIALTLQSYRFALVAQRGGTLRVPPLGVHFAARENFDLPSREGSDATKPFRVEVRMPPGVRAGEPVLATSELVLSERWEPRPGPAARVGDAFARTVQLAARATPAMLLPTLEPTAIPGFSVYSGTPQLRDDTARGAFRGERTLRLSYVCESAGSFELPPITLRWWDTQRAEWREERLPAVALEVAADPRVTARETPAPMPRSWGGPRPAVLLLGATLLLLLAVTAWRMPRLVRRWRDARAARSTREAASFGRLLAACRDADAGAAHRALAQWLGTLGASPAELLGGRFAVADDALREAVLSLEHRVAGLQPDWEPRALAAAARAARARIGRRRRTAPRHPLPRLNPP